MTSFDTDPSVADASPPAIGVHRIEVHPRPDASGAVDDPRGRQVADEIAAAHLAARIDRAEAARVYLIEAALDAPTVRRIADQLLADPVNQRAVIGVADAPEEAVTVEVHYRPGVMDPVAESTADAITEMLQNKHSSDRRIVVRTGYRYDLLGPTADEARHIAGQLLANTVVQSIHLGPHHPESFPTGSPYELHLRTVPLRDLDDAALTQLSREAHLFLSLDEMRAIRDYYRQQDREPTDIELETLAQTWSEHCVHKTLKSRIRYREDEPGGIDFTGRPGHTVEEDGAVAIDNLLKSTIAAATEQLREDGVDWCISVFVDNAGIIAFDETHGVTFKVETHNHPSAIEPYGGAATGIGGCIRDTMGTGLVAKPIANTDVFCVAHPDHWEAVPQADDGDGANSNFELRNSNFLPQGVIHPRRVLQQVVAGVRDYGNRMGIPTVNGAVAFDDRYIGNPLVFAGSVGLIPRDRCFGEPQPGDRIIALGGRTGRDGIHGATFSSAELTDTHADEFSHAVQIGNAITEKKVLDVMLQARDHARGPLFHAVTDCGAGGFSSAVGEMGERLGADVQLDRAPLKYDGLSYTEIWISEAQERMVVAVPAENIDALAELCAQEDVEWCDLGTFGTDNRELILRYDQTEVGRLGMAFLHEGLPQPVRDAHWSVPLKRDAPTTPRATESAFDQTLHALLAHPDIASKHWIIRQYDHEVQGGSVVKPLVGPEALGPSDAAVLRPKPHSDRGIALSVGLQTPLGDLDPYWMTLAAMDEAVRNAVCVGADPARIAVLDNFCWPSCEDPANLGSLVRAAEACRDGALAYRTPFISGKDSLNNQFTPEAGRTIAIPPTLLISAIGIVEDVKRCVSMDAKAAGNYLLQVGLTTEALGGSHLALLGHGGGDGDMPRVDLTTAPKQLATVAQLIADGHVRSAHDCSEGGLLVAAAEMAFAGGLGLAMDLAGVPRRGELTDTAAGFAETPSRVLIEIAPTDVDAVAWTLRAANIPFGEVGRFNDADRFTVRGQQASTLLDESLDALRRSWRQPLDW